MHRTLLAPWRIHYALVPHFLWRWELTAAEHHTRTAARQVPTLLLCIAICYCLRSLAHRGAGHAESGMPGWQPIAFATFFRPTSHRAALPSAVLPPLLYTRNVTSCTMPAGGPCSELWSPEQQVTTVAGIG